MALSKTQQSTWRSSWTAPCRWCCWSRQSQTWSRNPREETCSPACNLKITVGLYIWRLSGWVRDLPLDSSISEACSHVSLISILTLVRAFCGGGHISPPPFCPALSQRALDQYFEMCVCVSVCLSVCLSPNSRPLIGWATGFWQRFWHPTYPTRCSELGWAVPHSDFLAWLSSATLKISISGVSSRILML